ncbi:MAG: moderate conductance mechanosensitive channel [Acidimicrobiaceae bacterium]|nr:moderate conductance mechanosensitive channel [Acidimicrobiaceae bacterium]
MNLPGVARERVRPPDRSGRLLAVTHGYLYDLLRKLGLSDFGAQTGEFLLEKPARIGLTLLGAWLVSRFAVRSARRFVHSFHRRAPTRLLSVRAQQRAATIADALANLAKAVIWAIALLLVLDEVGVNLAPLLAGASVAGVAIAFGAQSLVKDFLSGVFILVEDQYGVGDVVSVGDATGTVEDLSLRVTRLRAMDGTVFFVPNGEIRKVGNSSMEWSRVLLDISVGYDADIEAVSSAIVEEAEAFAADPDFAGLVLDRPQLWGVQAMTADGQALRLAVKTAPRQQWTVARELRSRIVSRLRAESVPGPAGKAVVVSAGTLDQGSPVPAPAEGGRYG